MKPKTTFTVLAFACLALVLFVPGSAGAQTTPSSQAAAQQAAEGGAPQTARKTTGRLTGGIQIQSGATNVRGVEIQFTTESDIPGKSTLVTFAHYRYGRTTIYETPPITATVANRADVSIGIDKNFGSHGIFLERTSYARDTIQDLRYQFQQMAGVGVRFEKPARHAFRFVPGLSFVHEDKAFTGDVGSDVGAGFYQDLEIHLTPAWTFDQRVLFRRDFEGDDDYAYDGAASITGAITRRLGLQLQYSYSHQNLVRPGALKRYQNVQAGFQVRF